MLGKEKTGKELQRQNGSSQLGLPKLAEFINFFSSGGKLTSSVCCSSQLYVTDYFLLENPESNNQVTKRRQRNAIHTRALVQQSILNGAYFVKEASLNENRQFIDPYPYHPWKSDCLPLENPLSNSQITKRIQHRSCAGIPSEQVCIKVLRVAKEQQKLNKNILTNKNYQQVAFRFQSDQLARHLC